MIELEEIAPGRWRITKPHPKPKRSALPMPSVISDTMPAAEQVDGRFYESKTQFRQVGRAHGLTEVGTATLPPKQRASADPAYKQRRREAVRRVIVEYKGGRRPRRMIEA